MICPFCRCHMLRVDLTGKGLEAGSVTRKMFFWFSWRPFLRSPLQAGITHGEDVTIPPQFNNPPSSAQPIRRHSKVSGKLLSQQVCLQAQRLPICTTSTNNGILSSLLEELTIEADTMDSEDLWPCVERLSRLTKLFGNERLWRSLAWSGVRHCLQLTLPLPNFVSALSRVAHLRDHEALWDLLSRAVLNTIAGLNSAEVSICVNGFSKVACLSGDEVL